MDSRMISRTDALSSCRDFMADALELMEAKNKDYAGHGGQDAYRNFKRIADFMGSSVPSAILSRMVDKFSRLSSVVHSAGPAVKDETARDTLADLINYAALMAAWYQHDSPS